MKFPFTIPFQRNSSIARIDDRPAVTLLLWAVVCALLAGSLAGCSTINRMRAKSATVPTEAAAAQPAGSGTLRLNDAQAADGIVSLAGLRFQQCTVGQNATVQVCTGDAVSMNHFRADDYCKRLSLDNRRWRLPTRAELESILLRDQSFIPLTDPDVFPKTRPMMYWTGDPFHGAMSAFWTVDFMDGRTRGEDIFKNAYVRCVSGS